MSITINPAATTSASNSFLLETQGYVQGLSLDDPIARQWLVGGTVASTVAQPVWGGMAVSELLAAPGASGTGNSVAIATTAADICGFTVFDRAFNMLITPSGNSAPVAAAGSSVAYYRLGSNARIPVLCTAALITALEGNPSNTTVLWDPVNQQLVPSGTSGGLALDVRVVALNSNSKVVAYDSATQTATWTTGSVAVIQL